MDTSYTQIGRLKKAYGKDGGIRLVIFEVFKPLSKEITHFFILIDGIYVPFFPKEMGEVRSGLCHLEGISTLDQTEEIVGKNLFVKKDMVKPVETDKKEVPFQFLIGFELKTQDLKSAGKFDKIEEYPMQLMGILENGVMIPINEQNIIEIDKEAKIVIMDLPDGLLDV